MSVTIRFAGDVNDLLGKQNQVREGTERITDEWKQWLKQTKELDQSARKVLRDIQTDQERYNEKLRELNALYKSGRLNAEQFQRAVKQAQADMNGTIDKGQQGLGSYIGKLGGVALAVGSIREAWQAVLEVQREAIEAERRLAQKSNTVAEGIAGFVSMQPAGQKRARLNEVINLARGNMEIGAAAEMFQSIQSAAPGTDAQQFAVAKKAAAEIFAASRVGLPADLGGELAVQAFNVGMSPEQMIRAGVAAGVASKRGPKEVARAAPAMGLFDDPKLAMAVAGQLAGVDAQEVKSLTAAAARTLSGAEQQPVSEWFGSMGLAANATMAQRLEMLQKQGIDTVAEMSAVGINDSLQQRAIGALTRGQDIQALGTITQAIDAAISNPNYLAQMRKENERDVPSMKMSRLIREEESKRDELESFSVGAQERMLFERKLYNNLFEKNSETSTFGFQLFDESGNLDYGAFNRAKIMGTYLRTAETQVNSEMDPIVRENIRAESQKVAHEMQRRKPAIQKQEK